VAGRLELDEPAWRGAGFAAAYALEQLAGPDAAPGDSLTRAGELAELAGQRLAEEFLRP
jgi:glycerate kinase